MQPNSRILLAGLILAAGAGIGFWLSSNEKSVPMPDSSPQSDAPGDTPDIPDRALTPTPSTTNTGRTAPVQPHALPSISPHTRSGNGPESKIVEFEVVEGNLAIAYGDLILGRLDESHPPAGGPLKRGHTEITAPLLWDRPQIPYAINPDLPHPERVEKALEIFSRLTPVSFVPLASLGGSSNPDSIIFEPGNDNCYSSLGRMGGPQPIRLAPGCGKQEIIHEVMHALGFVHEQSRSDRDTYVQVLWDNIEDKFKPQFEKVPEVWMEAMRGSSFDYRSVLMYRPDTFASHPGQLTLQSTGTSQIAPVTEGLSEGDILRLKRLFRL